MFVVFTSATVIKEQIVSSFLKNEQLVLLKGIQAKFIVENSGNLRYSLAIIGKNVVNLGKF
jgi:hypothetical protein